MTPRITKTALVALVFFSMAGVARAQDAAQTKQARDSFKEGKKHFEAEEFELAAKAFRKAYSIAPSWKIHYSIGQCEAALKNFGIALDSFESYIAEGGDALSGERQDEVLKEIDRFRRMVGVVEISGLDGDQVSINGRNRGELPVARRHRVAMGETVLVVKRNGTTVLEETFRLSGGDTLAFEAPVSQTKAPAPVVTPKPTPSPEPVAPAQTKPATAAPSDTPAASESTPPVSPEAPQKPKRAWTWVALGLGAAALAGGGVLGGLAMGKEADIKKEQCDKTSCFEDARSDLDTVKSMNLTADILFGVGGAALVTGVVLFFVEPKRSKRSIEVAPAVSANSAWLSISGRF